MRRDRWLKVAVVIGMAVMAQGIAWADCGNCQSCTKRMVGRIPMDFCSTANDENGWMCCTTTTLGQGSYCAFSGEPCYGVVIDDPGGGGGGGGGGSCGYQDGWCPPSCMSCSGNEY